MMKSQAEKRGLSYWGGVNMWIRTHQTNRSPTAGVNMNRVVALRIHDLHNSSGEWELVAYFDHLEATEGTIEHSQCPICQGAREDVEFRRDWLLDQLHAQALPDRCHAMATAIEPWSNSQQSD